MTVLLCFCLSGDSCRSWVSFTLLAAGRERTGLQAGMRRFRHDTDSPGLRSWGLRLAVDP